MFSMSKNQEFVNHLLDEDVQSKKQQYQSFYRKVLAGNFFQPSRTANRVSDYINIDLDQPQRCLDQVMHSRCINDMNRLTSILREKESNKLYISEALIKTFPQDVLIRHFQKWCKKRLPSSLNSLKFEDILEKHWATRELDSRFSNMVCNTVEKHPSDEDEGLVSFYLPFTRDLNLNSLVKDLVDSMYVCGYNHSSTDILQFDEASIKDKTISIAYITFEPRYSDVDFKFSRWLYHITPFRSLKRIAENGLVPKSKNTSFKYPDRVHLFNGDSTMLWMKDYGLSKASLVGDARCALLRVSSEKLQNSPQYKSNHLKFFVDFKYESIETSEPLSIYTYDVVPRHLLDDEVLVFTIDNDRFVDKQGIKLSTI